MLAPVLAIALFALALEAGYRGYLYASFPDRFEPPPIGTVQANDASMWRFNARVGYEYVPSQTITTTTVVAGKVSGCGQTAPVNAEGNIRPTVPDYDTADLKVALFGDSFSASSLDGMTWPALLQDRLETITGNRTCVLNLARDGYGVLQMFELAAAKIREVRPHLAIFAFNSSALQRARTWRIEVGDGREARFLTSTTPVPTKMTSHDMMLLEPAATFDWCNRMLGRNRQQDDPVLQRILRKTANRIRRADLFDVTASYVVDLLAHQNAFSSQLAQLPSGIASKIAYTDYRSDPQFINAVQAVEHYTRLPIGKPKSAWLSRVVLGTRVGREIRLFEQHLRQRRFCGAFAGRERTATKRGDRVF